MKSAAYFNAAAGATMLLGLACVGAMPTQAAEPASGADITGKTVYFAPNARLRYGPSLLSRVYSRTSATLEIKGRGVCTAFNCPVVHNSVELFARRSQIDTDKPTTTVVTERTLRSGDEGEDVRIMQQALIKKGYPNVKPDASFGSTTEQAVRDFQRKNNIKIDGEIGAETRGKLSV